METGLTYGVGVAHKPKIALYAIGGNALSNPSLPNDQNAHQIRKLVIQDVLDLLEAGYRVVLTHGNGPQVGDLLMLEEANRNSQNAVARVNTGLANWVAATQGMIGHELGLELDSMLDLRDRPERTALVLTRVRVDDSDSAFASPSKPIGPVIGSGFEFPEDWDVIETELGLRRVVPSPEPLEILDIDLVQQLVSLGAVVICGGGGGIPVIKDEGWRGIAAVIDKDSLSSLLAVSLDANVFLISTPVENVELGFGTSSARPLTTMTTNQADEWNKAGEFPAGSMGPKVHAMIMAKRGLPDAKVALCSPGNALRTLRGESGTTISDEIIDE